MCGLQVLARYQEYEHLYVREREATLSEFQASSPHFSEYQGEMEHYERLEAEIKELPSQQYLNAAIQLSTGSLPTFSHVQLQRSHTHSLS